MKELLKQLEVAMKGGAKFASFKYLSKGKAELSRFVVILGASIENVYRSDVATLNALLPTLDGVKKVAAEEILISLNKSLDGGIGNNDAYTHGKASGDTYLATAIPNVVINQNDGALHLKNVLFHSKVVITAGPPKKPVNSSEKTLAKNELDRLLKRGKIMQFALEGISVAKLNGEVLEFE